MATNTAKEVGAYVAILFLLLGALFGSQIMAFIFGQLGPEAAGLTATDPGYNVSLGIQNDSLQSVKTYTASGSTQMNTVSIGVVLLLLIGIFLVFWKIFIKGGKKGSSMGGNFA